ncbi:MAG TPA: 2-dehydropantoate 2-reductase [Sporosarcina sp.]|nr:2-dehydropantoate 2-reductase [Sporosarcina sp.]
MKVAIIGAGSIGMLIGSYLAEAQMDVTMIVRNEQQAEALRRQGIHRLAEARKITQQHVHATTDYTYLKKADICVVAVKYAQLAQLIPQLEAHGQCMPMLFIQNGLAHVELIEQTQLDNVAFATVEHGALQLDLHTVAHNGVGKIAIGWKKGDHPIFKRLGEAACASFPITYDANVQQIIFRKVLINCFINPLTTVLRVPNGALIESPMKEQLIRQLYDECMTAFPSMKEHLSYEDVVDVCWRTRQNESSMLTDFKQGRPMEVETIVSAVIKRAEEEGKVLPLLTMLEQLLQALNEKA